MKLVGRNKKGQKILITVPDWDAISAIAGGGMDDGAGSNPGDTGTVVDTIAAQLTTSLSAYNAATVGNWVKVTQTEYNAVAANVSGATKKGNSDTEVNTRSVAVGYSTNWVSFGTSGVASFQIDAGEYVIGLISEAWNQNTGQTTLGYTTTFNGNTITQIGGNTAGTSTGGNRDYYIRKAPTDPATEIRYPVMKMTVSPNAVLSWNGYNSSNNGATWSANLANVTSKIQIITTANKNW